MCFSSGTAARPGFRTGSARSSTSGSGPRPAGAGSKELPRALLVLALAAARRVLLTAPLRRRLRSVARVGGELEDVAGGVPPLPPGRGGARAPRRRQAAAPGRPPP